MENSFPPLLSIIIATRNREYYCIESIKSILALDSNEIELAIADNSDSAVVKDFVATIDDKRLVYRYDNSPTSSIANFNNCMSLATGDYVCMIGDDDSVLRSIITVTKWASDNNIDSVCANRTINYYWPKAREIYPNGYLELPRSIGYKEEVDVMNEIKTLLKNGLQQYLLYKLPKTYHGLVKRSLMLEIKEIAGHFYGGLSPDIYSALAVGLLAKRHFQLDEPFTIAGVCPSSTSAENIRGDHSGTLESMPHLRNRGNYVWSNKVPRYYSVNTIWAESGIKALEEMDKFQMLNNHFNLYRMLLQGYINNKKFIGSFVIKQTLLYKKENKINTLVFYPALVINFLKIFIKKLSTTINDKQHPSTSFQKVENIADAIAISNKHYKI